MLYCIMDYTYKIHIHLEDIVLIRGIYTHFKHIPRLIIGDTLFFNHSKEEWIDENFFAEHNILENIQKNLIKSKQAMIDKGCHEEHSEWMKENNPASNTIWVNNGKNNKRVPETNIPKGFVKGRFKDYKLKRIERTCPHCGKVGKGPNMKRYHFDKCKKVLDK